MFAAPDAIQEFQRRRAETWRRTWAWLVLAAVSLGTFVLALPRNTGADPQLWQLNLGFSAFALASLAVVAVTKAIQRYYRCPACETVPRAGSLSVGGGGVGHRRRVALDPTE